MSLWDFFGFFPFYCSILSMLQVIEQSLFLFRDKNSCRRTNVHVQYLFVRCSTSDYKDDFGAKDERGEWGNCPQLRLWSGQLKKKFGVFFCHSMFFGLFDSQKTSKLKFDLIRPTYFGGSRAFRFFDIFAQSLHSPYMPQICCIKYFWYFWGHL